GSEAGEGVRQVRDVSVERRTGCGQVGVREVAEDGPARRARSRQARTVGRALGAPALFGEGVMAGCAGELGKLRPALAPGAAREEVEARGEGRRLPDRPGARALGSRVLPVRRHGAREVVELEGEHGMAGRDQLVIDRAVRIAEMAGEAEAGADAEVLQVAQAGAHRIGVAPPFRAVPFEPAARRAVAALAGEAVLDLQARRLLRARHGEGVAGEAGGGVRGRAEAEVADDRGRARVEEHLVGTPVAVALVPGE